MNAQKICINSFPKSGSTWLGFTIYSLFKKKGTIKDIIPTTYNDQKMGRIVETPKGSVCFVKAHDKEMLPIAETLKTRIDKTIYIYRHPLDVFCSQLNSISANSTNNSIETTILPVKSVEDALEKDILDYYFHLFLVLGTLQPEFREAGNWFSNVEYWTRREREEGDVCCLQYENMLSNPVKELGKALLPLGFSKKDIEEALKSSQTMTRKDGRFFWRKKKDTYLEFLSTSNILEFYRLHGNKLKDMGLYENSNYQP